MLRIVSHIKALLQVHDCVIIPGFGGFVLQASPATYDAEKQLFSPMRKELLFNENLQHTDGLLAESYMRHFQVDYRKASRMVEEDVLQLRHALSMHGSLTLNEIGQFRVGAEGHLDFLPEDSPEFTPEAYGLPAFHFRTLAALQREEVTLLTQEKKPSKDTIYIPVSRTLVRTFTASAAAIAMFLLVSTPVRDVNKSAYTASFIPTEMIVASVSSLEEVFSEPVVEVMVVKEEVTAVTQQAPAPEAPVKNRKMYHIVIGSFVTDKQADDFISEVNRSVCTGVNKITRDGKVRVYADRFVNREEAEQYLEQVRMHEKYKDAWLFISR
ncbi:MAG: SPOR domain-containing protein [Tannerellaceae bacterium]|nr:SPOR domain-containing protein [Tannerellaceae bacterium]